MRFYALWSLFFFVLLLFFKITFSDDVMEEVDEEDTRRPIWNIAHMVNALYQVDYYLNKGANALEFDVSFDTDGVARFTFHGVPCDCFRSCTKYEDFVTYIKYLRRLTTPGDPVFREQLVLLFLDFKVSGLSPGALGSAGEDVAKKLLNYYWEGGTSGARAKIILSLPSINHVEVINKFLETIDRHDASKYKSIVGFDFSNNEDLDIIRSGVKRFGIDDHVWQGDGITNCLPRGTGRLLQAINRRDNRKDTYIDKVYWWTVDRMSTMRRTLSLGVDALITNYPRRLVDVLNENEFSGQVRLATIYDDPWKRYPRRTASLISILPLERNGNVTSYGYEEPEEMLYNS